MANAGDGPHSGALSSSVQPGPGWILRHEYSILVRSVVQRFFNRAEQAHEVPVLKAWGEYTEFGIWKDWPRGDLEGASTRRDTVEGRKWVIPTQGGQ